MVGSLVIAKFKNKYIQALITAVKGKFYYGFEVITTEQLLQKVTSEEKEITYIYDKNLIVNGQNSVILFDKLVKFNESDLSNPTGDYKDLATAVVGHYNLPKIENLFDKHAMTAAEKAELNEKLEYAYIAIETYEVDIMTISQERLEALKHEVIKSLGKQYKLGCYENSLEHIWEDVIHDTQLHEVTPIEIFKAYVACGALTGLTLSSSDLGFEKIETTKKGLSTVDLPKTLLTMTPVQIAKKYVKSLSEKQIEKIHNFILKECRDQQNSHSPNLWISDFNKMCNEVYLLDHELRFVPLGFYEFLAKHAIKTNDVTFKLDECMIKITDEAFIQEQKLAD
ncbi:MULTISPECIES: hypothetical protein [unclassified Fusibacter]|uniref:hypothetical protein n=1 Tax=unclassified Fusibacter TaxID=2624464 RepID=UPI001013817F|nr:MULTISPECIES: hypothetical protein [unclassified Fusibacter]MCK8058516.1 hypothetical protein [Fusibacter sp. A2]NPE22715.1 hypothetical protein [Fusibacter sp. A1]RXV60275.1 hypothetical protein DWB64_12765 [Fusibacter sp. A1]